MKTAEEEIKYAIKEAIQVLEHYDNGEDFALSTCLKRLKDIDASQFKAGEPYRLERPVEDGVIGTEFG